MTVLLVEDDDRIRQLMKKTLIATNHDVSFIETAGPGAAIGQLSESQIDVLILDLEMPGGNGTEVLKWLQNKGKKPVIIVFTNHANLVYRNTCFRLGADYFYDKSFEFEKLINSIKTLSL